MRQRGKQNWQITIHAGVPPDGKYMRHCETLTGRSNDAQRRLTEVPTAVDRSRAAQCYRASPRPTRKLCEDEHSFRTHAL